MAFNIPGLPFKLTPQDMGGVDLADSLSKGFKMYGDYYDAQYKPKNLAEALLASQLQNKINQPKADHAEEITLADLAHTRAGTGLIGAQTDEARFYAKNPLLKLPGAAGQIGASLYLNQNQGTSQPTDSTDKQDTNQTSAPGSVGANYPQMILDSLSSKTSGAMAKADYDTKRSQSFAYSTAPVDTKNYMLAQAAGMGIAPDKAVNEFAMGKTIDDLAKENGFDPEALPDPDYAPTKQNVTQLKQRQAALGEMNHLAKFVTEGLGPYAKTMMGWSPEQIGAQLKNMDPDKQAKFLAARGLVPELTNMRLMTANAKGTVSAIKSLQEKSLLNIKALQSQVDPKVWMKAQKLMDEELAQAMGASIKKYQLKGNKQIKAEHKMVLPESYAEIKAMAKKQGITPDQLIANSANDQEEGVLTWNPQLGRFD